MSRLKAVAIDIANQLKDIPDDELSQLEYNILAQLTWALDMDGVDTMEQLSDA